jgi:hypothetical protein
MYTIYINYLIIPTTALFFIRTNNKMHSFLFLDTDVDMVLSKVRAFLPLTHDCEVTMEVDPGE